MIYCFYIDAVHRVVLGNYPTEAYVGSLNPSMPSGYFATNRRISSIAL
jgi:hypothetical protein